MGDSLFYFTHAAIKCSIIHKDKFHTVQCLFHQRANTSTHELLNPINRNHHGHFTTHTHCSTTLLTTNHKIAKKYLHTLP